MSSKNSKGSPVPAPSRAKSMERGNDDNKMDFITVENPHSSSKQAPTNVQKKNEQSSDSEDTTRESEGTTEKTPRSKNRKQFDLDSAIPWIGCCCCMGTFTDCFPFMCQCEACGLGINAECCECVGIFLDCCPHVDQWCGVDQCACCNCQGGKCFGCSWENGKCCSCSGDKGKCCSGNRSSRCNCCQGPSCCSRICWCCRIRLVIEEDEVTIGKKEKQEQAEAAVAPGVPARAPSVKLKGPSAPKVHMSGPELPKFEAPQVKGHCMKCSCCPWLAEVVPGCDSSQDCCGFSCWKCEFGFPCSSCCTGACNVAKIKIISGTSVPCILNVCFCNCCFRCKRATACCATLSEIALKAGFAAKEAVVGDDSL